MLREGKGETAGETLGSVVTAFARGSETDQAAFLEGRDMLICGSETFPAVWWEGQWVPEARSHKQVKLPHQHENHESLFPKATVCSQVIGPDFDEDVGELESHGETLGRMKVRKIIDGGLSSGRGPQLPAAANYSKASKSVSWESIVRECKDKAWADLDDD